MQIFSNQRKSDNLKLSLPAPIAVHFKVSPQCCLYPSCGTHIVSLGGLRRKLVQLFPYREHNILRTVGSRRTGLFTRSITVERLYHSDLLPPTEKAVLEKDVRVGRKGPFLPDSGWPLFPDRSKANQDLIKGGTPQEMLNWFGTDNPDIAWQASTWLK